MRLLGTEIHTGTADRLDSPPETLRAQWTEQLLAMMRSSDTEEWLERACRIAMELLGLDAAAVTRLAGDTQSVVASTTDDVPKTLPVGPHLQRIFAHGGVVMIRDVRRLRFVTPYVDALGFRCMVAVPIVVEGEPWGLFTVGSPHPRATRFPPLAGDLMDGLRRTLSHLIERDEARSRLVPVERLRQSNRELERYACAAAHDLRAPLRAIHGFADLALDSIERPSGTERSQALLRRIIDNAERMEELLLSMLDHAKATESTGPIGPVDVNQEVERIIDAAIIDHACVGADIDIGSLPVLNVDRGQLRRVLHNIVDNAIKYRRRDRPLQLSIQARAVVDVGTTSSVEAIEIRFTDNGRGIEHHHRSSAFELFTRHAADVDGTGVGLAVVRRVMEEMGGSATLDDGQDGGLTVCLRFPATLISSDNDEVRNSLPASP